MQGTIVKGIGGFYYVKVNDNIIECKARGKFRHNELTPMIGDNVDIFIDDKSGSGFITKIQQRRNQLIRPAVANVTQAFVVFALKNPVVNLDLLNKFLVFCEYHKIKAIPCLNKIDLIDNAEESDIVNMIKLAKYEVCYLNAKEGKGIENLLEKLSNNVTVFCGPSGVGKSTILNKIVGKEIMETGDLSNKHGRGKHTTRHIELVEVDDGFLVDTPGFSSLNISFIDKHDLQFCFPEFHNYIGNCRFTGCLHHKEPDCAVKTAVSDKIIDSKRYDFYIKTLEEVMKIKRTN